VEDVSVDAFDYNLIHAKHVIANHKRRSKGLVSVTDLDIADLLTNTNKCKICGKYFYHEKEKTIDHIIPVCRDGELAMNNIQVLCLICNSKKDSLTRS
jgi:5-methylcytosine-specific restriction endonuclease McrA